MWHIFISFIFPVDCFNYPKDGPASPKKFKNVPELDFRGRCSSVSSEWALVRVIPEEELTENNLLAVRVMVTSDGSSSDLEPDFDGDASISGSDEGLSPLPEPRTSAPSLRKPVLRNTSLGRKEEGYEKSKAANGKFCNDSIHSRHQGVIQKLLLSRE
ncbi:F-actin-monooxygenase MICAL2-like [Podarcis raffonei]|uniref:F-actin-monooxygenase MICAL2-like n=1 Tax=Podarcis raffonei TaxID=65483 RepID=UPI0023290420|nr:F-actin-monooxygenase MICAL2-like [Podarcis raffonei]